MDRIDLMRSFVAVAETGSFTAAAARLGLSNKLVSKYVAALEQRLGQPLLFRTTRTLSLTEAGTRYLDGARRALAALEEAEAALIPDDGLSGRLRVAAPITFGEGFVTRMTRDFLALHPRMEVELALSDALVDLAQGGFDMAVRIGNLSDSSLIARRIGTAQNVIAASPDYLTRMGTPAHPEDLARHDCIRDTNARDWTRWRFEIDGREQQIRVGGRFAANNASACLTLARSGAGVFSGLDIFAAADLRAGRLVRVLDGFPSGATTIQTVYLPSAFRQDKLRAYSDFLVRHFAEDARTRS